MEATGLAHGARLARGTHLIWARHGSALTSALIDESRLLEQICVDAPAVQAESDISGVRKAQLEELAKARRVVVALRLGVAEGFEDGVALHDALIKVGSVALRACAAGAGSPREVAQNDLGRLRLAGARLARHHNRLALRCRLG